MDIEKTSSTYLRYLAGAASYAAFFDGFYSTEKVGFCPMMRTIYFWRPFIAAIRVLMMALSVTVVCVAFYVKAPEIVAGAAIFLFLALGVWVAKIAVLASGDYFESKEVVLPLVFLWVKASYDKVCPLVTFTEKEKCDE